MAFDQQAYKSGYDAIDWRALPPPPLKERGPVARANLPVPHVITDTMPAAEHVDGKFYESKSAFRRVTRENGYVEIGNDPARLETPKRPVADKASDDRLFKAALDRACGV